MKVKIYKIFFIILIILVLLTITLIIIKYEKSNVIEKMNQKTAETFSNFDDLDEKVQNLGIDDNTVENGIVEMNGYKVIGLIKISKINLEYPILDIDAYNPEETKEPMKFAIVKYWGGNVNDYGNLSIAGHNNYNGTMFGKTKKLEKGDIVELVDLNHQSIKYKIYDIFITNPNDITILQTEDNTVREVTLITCTNGNKNRLILKAREMI